MQYWEWCVLTLKNDVYSHIIIDYHIHIPTKYLQNSIFTENLLPTQVKIGHEGILSQEKNLVKFFTRKTRPMVSRYKTTIREKPLDVCWTWWWGKVPLHHLEKGLLEGVFRGGSFLIILPESALFTITFTFSFQYVNLRHLKSSRGSFR